MKKAFTTFFAVILFFAIAIASSQAQTNATDAALTNSTIASAEISSAMPVSHAEEKKTRRNKSNSEGFAGVLGNVEVIVPLAGMFISFAIPVTIIAICAYARNRRHKMANETLRAMIEKGQPITPELVASLKSKHSETDTVGADAGNPSRKDLRNGILLVGIGAGIVMLCGKPGWIVLFIGVAFLLIGMLNLGKAGK